MHPWLWGSSDTDVSSFPGQHLTHHDTTKHIELRYYWLCEMANEGLVVLEKVDTADQVADIFTKALPYTALTKHRSSLVNANHNPNV